MKAAWKRFKEGGSPPAAHESAEHHVAPEAMPERDRAPAAPRAALDWADIVCRVCAGGESDDQIVLCDACNAGTHMYCLTPPMKALPEGRWFCPECESQPLLLQMRIAALDAEAAEREERASSGRRAKGRARSRAWDEDEEYDNQSDHSDDDDGGGGAHGDDQDHGSGGSDADAMQLQQKPRGFYKRSTSIVNLPRTWKACRGCYAKLKVAASTCPECGFVDKNITLKRRKKEVEETAAREASPDLGLVNGSNKDTQWTPQHDQLLLAALDKYGSWEQWKRVCADKAFELLWLFDPRGLRKRLRKLRRERAAGSNPPPAKPKVSRRKLQHPTKSVPLQVPSSDENQPSASSPLVATDAFVPELWLLKSSSFVAPPEPQFNSRLLAVPPLPPADPHSGIQGWLMAWHESHKLAPVPVYADKELRIGRSSHCELSVPASAKHTSRVHASLRYDTHSRVWSINVSGKQGLMAGPDETAFIAPQPGWVSLSFIAWSFSIPADRLRFSVHPIAL